MLAFLHALDADRRWTWAIASGALLGAAGLIQVQLLLPIPLVLIVVALAVGRDPRRLRRAVLATVATGTIAGLAVGPWLLDAIGLIRRNGGIALDSAETLLPLRLNLWDLPREF